MQHLNAPVPPLPAHVPPALAGVVLRSLAKEPAGRYATGGEMAAALAACATAPADVPPRPGARHRRAAVPPDEAAITQPGAPRAPEPPTRAVPAPLTARLHGRRRHRHRWRGLLAGLALLAVAIAGAAVAVPRLIAAGHRATVPALVGERASAAAADVRRARLVPRTEVVPVPGGTAGTVTRQVPAGGTRLHRGDAVTLVVVAPPAWRPVASSAGASDGGTSTFRIQGGRSRIRYHVDFPDGCGLLFGCFGPSATVQDAGGNEVRTFDMEQGDHVVELDAPPGTYQVQVSAGADRADWTLGVDDRY